MSASGNCPTKTWLLVELGAATQVGVMFAAIALGTTALPPGRSAAALFSAGSPSHGIVVGEFRLPRALAAMLAFEALPSHGLGARLPNAASPVSGG
ncbi:MAG: hypothetical protein AAGA68_08255 [Pseudomonadota bacterium]